MKSLFAALFVLLFISCNPDEDDIQKDFREENEQEIIEYINANGLEATRTDSGLYYVIDEQGEGAEITATSDVSVRYKGYFTNGVVIDQNQEVGFSINLQQAIYGWTEGLQFFKEGGSGMLLVPSHLAYGSQDYAGIPGGSVLIFDVELIDYDAENREEILEYISNNDIEAIESDTGLFYEIEEPGSGAQPTENSTVTVVYKGYFTDGELFDESSEAGLTMPLNQLIDGWIEGIQYFKEGGSGTLIIPSSLAYGRYGTQSIPGGSVLRFDVHLKTVD